MRLLCFIYLTFLISLKGYSYLDFPISTAPEGQLYPDVCWDGEEFWVVWQDARDGYFAIYGTRVTEKEEVLDPEGIKILGIPDSDLIYPSIAWDGNTCGIIIHFNPNNLAFVRIDREGNSLDTCFVRPVEVEDWYGYGYYDGKPRIAGKDGIFYLFSHGHSWYDWEGFFDAYVLKWERDSIKGPWCLPRSRSAGQITGTIKNDSCFVIYDSDWPRPGRVLGYVFYDTLVWNSDIFLIRTVEELSPYNPFGGYKVISKGKNGFLLVSEASSKIWLEILSSNGRPALPFPIIWDNGEAISQTNPSSAYGENKYTIVWQDSSGRGTDIYVLSVDTLGRINNHGYIKKEKSEEKQPAIAYGNGKYLLVWADNKNGDFDIYGMLMDSLSIGMKETSKLSRISYFSLSPNPFTERVKIQFFLDRESKIEGRIYNVLGKLIKIIPAGYFRVGNHYLEWNGIDRQGREVSAGIYFIELSRKSQKRIRKVVKM